MMKESINEWMVEVFCSDAANEAMDEWQLAQGSTQPRVTQSRQTNHCALQIIVQGRTKFSVQPVWSKGAHALKLLQTFYITRQNKVLSADKRIHTIYRCLRHRFAPKAPTRRSFFKLSIFPSITSIHGLILTITFRWSWFIIHLACRTKPAKMLIISINCSRVDESIICIVNGPS